LKYRLVKVSRGTLIIIKMTTAVIKEENNKGKNS
jgi:hypothetical protein